MTMRRPNGYKVIEIWWLSGIGNFVSERNDFIFNPFRNLKPVKRFQNRSDVLELWNMSRDSSLPLHVFGRYLNFLRRSCLLLINSCDAVCIARLLRSTSFIIIIIIIITKRRRICSVSWAFTYSTFLPFNYAASVGPTTWQQL